MVSRLIIVFFFYVGLSNAQEGMDISFWSDVMMNANSPEHRELALNNFQKEFSLLSENGNPFEFDYDRTPELSILSDSMETFKLITWQFQKSNTEFDYFGYLIRKDGTTYQLRDGFSNFEDLEYLSLDSEEWLGGIYYNLIEMGEKIYLFSYRQLDEFTKFKSFDVLSFSNDGDPILGGEDFVFPSSDSRNVVKNRITFKYSVDAILSLNYNKDMKMVVHDHLMQVIGQYEGQGPTMVPDGTYEGYIFKDGQWVYEEKLFDHTYDEAPRPNQILGKSKRDVFGNEKKN